MGVTSTAAADDGLRDALLDFRGVYRAHYGFVWHALHRFGTAPALLDDAVQDVFVVAYRRRADYRGPSPKPWLYGIARRVASNYRRSIRRRIARDDALPRATHVVPADTAREAIETLDRFLAALSAGDRELFVLAKLEGMTGRELALATGRNMQTLYTRLRKLEAELQGELGELERVRRARPRASAQSWAVLVPALQASVVPTGAAVATATSTWGWVLAAMAVAAVGLVIVDPLHHDADAPELATSVSGGLEATPTADARGQSTRLSATPIAVEPSTQSPSAVPTAIEPEVPASPATKGLSPQDEPAASVRPRAHPADTESEETSSGGLRVETELLRRASTQLGAGDAAAALRTTTDHTRRFPGSALADLRTAVRIEALCRLGKASQARGEARVFLRDHPGSPVAERIEHACEGSPKKSADADKTGT